MSRELVWRGAPQQSPGGEPSCLNTGTSALPWSVLEPVGTGRPPAEVREQPGHIRRTLPSRLRPQTPAELRTRDPGLFQPRPALEIEASRLHR